MGWRMPVSSSPISSRTRSSTGRSRPPSHHRPGELLGLVVLGRDRPDLPLGELVGHFWAGAGLRRARSRYGKVLSAPLLPLGNLLNGRMRVRAVLRRGWNHDVPIGIRLRAAERRVQLLGWLGGSSPRRLPACPWSPSPRPPASPSPYSTSTSPRSGRLFGPLAGSLAGSPMGWRPPEPGREQRAAAAARVRGRVGFVDRSGRLPPAVHRGPRLDADFQEQVAGSGAGWPARVAVIIASEAGRRPRAGALAAPRRHGRGRGRLVAGRHRQLAAGELADELTGLAWKGFAGSVRTREPDGPADLPQVALVILPQA